MPRVLDGRWLGNEAFAVVTERIQGDTLDELLERGEKFTNPRIAMMLQEVSGVLDWAREQGVVHRGVTQDTLWFERGTNRMHVAFTPTPIPMSGVPDASGDARTIATLAWTILTGERYAEGETRSLGEVCPNLATRVIEATDRMIRAKDHADAPDVGTFLGIIASGDVLKQAEVEMAAQKEEYDEQHRVELQKCELHREEVEQHAAEQASILAGEREEFLRMMADERAAIEAERLQVDAAMNERKDRLAAVRAELDQQRAEMERRLAELEQYRLEVEKVRDDALAAREEAKAAQATAASAAAAHLAAVKAAQSAQAAQAAQLAEARERTPESVESVASLTPVAAMAPVPAMPPELQPLKPAKLAKPPKAPKWDRIEPVDLEHTDKVTVGSGGRPRWMIPAGVATLALILVAVIYGFMHRGSEPGNTIRLGKSTVVPTAPAAQNGIVPRGGFLTQSAGGSLAPKFVGSPVTTPADSTARAAAALTPPVLTQAQTDSIAAAAAARQKRAAARAEAARIEEARRRATRPSQAEIDSMNTPASMWNRRPRPDTTTRRDTVRPDTTVKRDSIRPRPDTTAKRR
jgi:hypothetical protein